MKLHEGQLFIILNFRRLEKMMPTNF